MCKFIYVILFKGYFACHSGRTVWGVGSNLSQVMHICLCFCDLLSCVGTGLATS
jgi:hypothetical protein